MKKLFVLCSLVVAVTCQPVNDVSSLTGFLAEAQKRFNATLDSDPDNILSVTLADMVTALSIAKDLVTNKVITLEKGAFIIIDAGFTVAMNAALVVPSIAQFNQAVCAANQFPFPDFLLNGFPQLTSELNTRVPDLSDSLGYK